MFQVRAGRSTRLCGVVLALACGLIGVTACEDDARLQSQNATPGTRPSPDCPAFTNVRSTAGRLALDVSPDYGTPGQEIEVSRTDGRRMKFGPLLLAGDAASGCRLFIMSPGVDGNQPWFEVTGEKEVAMTSIDRPAAPSGTYQVPDDAGPGSYLLCLFDGHGNACGPLAIQG